MTTPEGTTHPCSFPGCDQTIPSDHFMCIGHWRGLPEPMKREINISWGKLSAAFGAVSRMPEPEVYVERYRALRAAFLKASADHNRTKEAVIQALEEYHRASTHSQAGRGQDEVPGEPERDQEEGDSG